MTAQHPSPESEAYTHAMEYVKSLDGITQYRYRQLGRRMQKTSVVKCPECLIDNVTTELTIEACIPPDDPHPADAHIGNTCIVSCGTCHHKGCFTIEQVEPEGMNVEKAFRRKQRKRRRKRK